MDNQILNPTLLIMKTVTIDVTSRDLCHLDKI